MSPPGTTLEAVLRRDRAIVVAGLLGVVALAWAYILAGAGMAMSPFDMSAVTVGRGGNEGAIAEAMGMAAAAMQPAVWSTGYAALMFFMWWIMMIAMMLPGAAPMILLYALVNRRQRRRGAPFVPTGVFALGYVLAWAAFSVGAAGLQWGLERTGLVSSMMASTSVAFGGMLLIGAGIYQLSPLKQACLRHCRAPVDFLSRRWRKGRLGALGMGIEHGAFCLGCCWVLMGLLFLGGVMNLYWIIGLAVFVLLEKTLPAGHRLGAATGLGLVAWGGALVAGTLLAA